MSDAIAVAAGGYHSLALLANGDVYSFGNNDCGQLGQGDNTARYEPTKIASLSGAVAVDAGFEHSLVLLGNGDVYSFGGNAVGQLGHGDTTSRSTPTKIATLSGVIAMAAGGLSCSGVSHSLAVLGNGDVYSFGDNCWGQLGHGDFDARLTPTKIATLSNAAAVAAGSWHSFVLLQNGDTYSFGRNTWGQLGLGDTSRRSTPTKVVSLSDAVSVAASRYASFVVMQPPPPDTLAVFRVDEGGRVLADGAFYGDSFQSGSADVAEWVTVSQPLEAGDVVEFDPTATATYRLSAAPCSSLVAGVVSTEPGIVLGATVTDHSSPITYQSEALLALTGIVPVKVTDEGGPIRPGDLLVSSSTPGHAMRWAGPEPCPCALVGKALEPMTDETGMILVLLTAH